MNRVGEMLRRMAASLRPTVAESKWEPRGQELLPSLSGKIGRLCARNFVTTGTRGKVEATGKVSLF
jgi:hypothetical protein